MTEQYNRMRHGELLGTPLTAKKVLDGRQKNRYHTTCDNAEPADKKRAFSFAAQTRNAAKTLVSAGQC
jgi:hypothetical protein